MTNPSNAVSFKLNTIFSALTKKFFHLKSKLSPRKSSLVIVSGIQFFPLPLPFSMALGKPLRRGLISPSSGCLEGRTLHYLIVQVPFAVSMNRNFPKNCSFLLWYSLPRLSESLTAGVYLVLLPMPRISLSTSDHCDYGI